MNGLHNKLLITKLADLNECDFVTRIQCKLSDINNNNKPIN